MIVRRVSFVNNIRRELKETRWNNWKIPCQAIMLADHRAIEILYLPITFGVSEKRLCGQILDELRSDTPPR
ncbi:hypothetical protein T03_8279 [Trichinella britovi]|uniref:Uncharacterized protein n=1 Tax=Trichinella britovi TaxID=45882 RepID=A0A0V1D4N8_TRIBR|nr:hypothetical protein T03_8279 [Trichinella britovi]